MRHEDLVPFHRPTIAATAAEAVAQVLASGVLTGGGPRTQACHDRLVAMVPGAVPFLTTSCTDALEMACLILGIAPGDEVVMPSWTFASSANAVLLRGGVPVFVDVEPGTLNVDPAQVAAAMTVRTRAVLCVHYAGVGCRMGPLRTLCAEHGAALVEDAAQGFGAQWEGRALGGWGDLAAYSFHGTKNVSCGEGGALMVNRPDLVEAAEICWEKGTSRVAFARKGISHYDWVGLGSSFLPSEVTAAVLEQQFAIAERLNDARRRAWSTYARLLSQAGASAVLQLPEVPPEALHNGHIYAVRVPDVTIRSRAMTYMAERGIETRTHYRPLHASPAGRRHGRVSGSLPVTVAAGEGLIRLPLDAEITPGEQERVVGTLLDGLRPF